MFNRINTYVSSNKLGLLFFGCVILMGAITNYYGNLNVPPGGTITDQNAASGSCMQTTTGGKYAYTGLPCGTGGSSYTFNSPLSNTAGTIACSLCVTTSANNNFTGINTFVGQNLSISTSGLGGSANRYQWQNTASTLTGGTQAIGGMYAYASTINSGCSSGQPVDELWPGITGASSGNYGGYWVFWTKTDGACSGLEALVLTANAHVYLAGPRVGAGSTAGCNGGDSSGYCNVALTPGTCSAGVPCGTVTVNFGQPFYQIDGVTGEIPYCTYSIQDTNLTTNAWMAVPETVAFDHIVIGYVPLVAQATNRTLMIYWHCTASSY